MKKYFKLNSDIKLLLLIIGTSVFFFSLSLILFFYTVQEEKKVFQDSEKQYRNEINKLLVLNAEPLVLSIGNDTNWDEFVKFIETKDFKWYYETIGNEIDVYKADYLGVYDINKKFIIHTSNLKIKLIDFIPQQTMAYINKSKFSRFYIKTSDGILEVFGATIHPSSDPTKTLTKPVGYFFMARVLDKDYLKILQKTTDSQISFSNKDVKNKVEKAKITSIQDLKDLQNNIVGTLIFQRNYNTHFLNAKNILFIIIVAFFVIIILYLYYTHKWIHNPLQLIAIALKTENRNAINKLKNIKGEYSYIGKLFEENRVKRIELEIAKNKAEENDKLKSIFLANLSHEIRTPMNAIVGFSDLVNNPNLNEAEKKHYLKIIKNNGNSLLSIIEDLIEMSKIDAHQIISRPVSIDLKKCVLGLYSTLKVTISAEKEIDFQLIEPINPIKNNILTDEVKLKQIIINLISNAIKFTDKGHITFGYTVDEDNRLIEFTIQDSGIGIKKKNLSAIFDRFQRVETDFSIKLCGLGLGLSISKAYVDMMGGTLIVKSKIGVGSTFSFSIPLKFDESEKEHNIKALTNLNENNLNKIILVAEDNNINFLLLKKILQLKNHTVLRAENGQEAVDICRNNQNIDLVFMDIKMPVLDGYGALKEIKTFMPNLSILAQTAHSSPEDIEKIIQAGFDNYIIKPLDKDKIYELIETVFQNNIEREFGYNVYKKVDDL